jgi:hypothetical protein
MGLDLVRYGFIWQDLDIMSPHLHNMGMRHDQLGNRDWEMRFPSLRTVMISSMLRSFIGPLQLNDVHFEQLDSTYKLCNVALTSNLKMFHYAALDNEHLIPNLL